ncbi:RNA polymerase sigma factor [Paenibacillus sp. HB172176]|uniref:RNA polymerase sigma factor n=1 Tax=Paenibacillus sp. HB172176 TaxID=2493690 RepID=UPI00143AAD91|nr:RNA polymerase sigma factor [Paenibacillus sp. HB172176]
MRNRALEKKLVHWINENKENIYRLAYSYVRNKEDALDIVQDSIIKALAAIHRLVELDAIKSWFYKIVVHTALDFLRKHKRIQVTDPQVIAYKSAAAEDHYANLDLERELESLPQPFREVVVLRYFEDLKLEEVADVLSMNISTVKSRLYRALRLLKINMDEEPSQGRDV